jgi:uncharacterized caspase-like protein
VRLFRNGSLVRLWGGDAFDKASGCQPVPAKAGEPHRALCQATVKLVAGENQLTAFAFNRDDVKSADATLVVKGGETLRRQGTAYILAAGVNRYVANPFFNDLKFAVADAEEFAAEVKRQQEQLGKYEKVEVVKLTDEAATKAGILNTLAELAKKTQPEDSVIVYFAGHGLAEGGKFYLIPHDIGVGNPAKQPSSATTRTNLNPLLAARGISDAELEDAFEGVDAGQLMMIIDACNSGQALGGEREGRGPMNSKGLAQLAYYKGMYVLTAAQSFQAALEASHVGHGLLTYALVMEGLSQAAADGEPKDGTIHVREWLDYATERVPEMQIDKMKAARGLGLNLSFKEDERGLELDKRSGQRPRVFYRRELEAQPPVVAKTGAVQPD